MLSTSEVEVGTRVDDDVTPGAVPPESTPPYSVFESLRARLRRVWGDSLVRNSLMLVLTAAVNAGFGYLYWMVAARLFEDAVVGRATAVIAAMNLTALVANLGLGTTLVEHLPTLKDETDWQRRVAAVAMLGIGSGLTLGVVVAVGLPIVADAFSPIMDVPMTAVFIVGVVIWVGAVLTDRMFVAERRADGMLARSGSFAVGKLLFLVPFGLAGVQDERWLVGTWVLGSTLSVVGGVFFLAPRIGRRIRLRVDGARAQIRPMVASTLGHHMANLGGEFPMFLLPVIVITRAGEEAAAYFYVTWMVGSVFFTVSTAAASSLFAEGRHDPAAAAHQLRRALLLIGAILTPIAAVMVLFGRTVLGLFGDNYAAAGYPLLVVLVLSAVPDAVTNIWVARWRVKGWIAQTAIANDAMAAIALGFTWWKVPTMGIEAAGWGWVISQTLGTIYTFAVEGWHRWRSGHADPVAEPSTVSPVPPGGAGSPGSPVAAAEVPV